MWKHEQVNAKYWVFGPLVFSAFGVGTHQTRLLTSAGPLYFVAFTANMALKSGGGFGNRVAGIGGGGMMLQESSPSEAYSRVATLW